MYNVYIDMINELIHKEVYHYWAGYDDPVTETGKKDCQKNNIYFFLIFSYFRIIIVFSKLNKLILTIT